MVIFVVVFLDFSLTNFINHFKNNIRVRHPIYHHTFKKSSKNVESFRGKKINIYTNSLGVKKTMLNS